VGNQKVLYHAERHAHTAQGLALATVHGDLLWLDGGWPGSCHEQELLTLAGLEDALDRVQVVSLLDRGFRGMAKPRERWHMPLGDRRTKDQLTQAQRAYNREQAGLRALVEQAIAQLGDAWVLRRWRGLLYRPPTRFCPTRMAGAVVPAAASQVHAMARVPGHGLGVVVTRRAAAAAARQQGARRRPRRRARRGRPTG
jgi:hypothetical protein